MSTSAGSITGSGAITGRNLELNTNGGDVNLTATHALNFVNVGSGTVSGFRFVNGRDLGVGPIAAGAGGIDITVNGTLTQASPITTSGTNAAISLKAGDIVLASGVNQVNAGTGTVNIGTFDGAGAMFIGEASGSGLKLSNTELQAITAGTLNLGNSTQTGNITIKGAQFVAGGPYSGLTAGLTAVNILQNTAGSGAVSLNSFSTTQGDGLIGGSSFELAAIQLVNGPANAVSISTPAAAASRYRARSPPPATSTPTAW